VSCTTRSFIICTFTKCHYDGQIEDIGIGKTCSKHEIDKSAYKILVRKRE
jgi:hypothetical protein